MRIDGQVWLDGVDLFGTGVDPADVRRRIALVPQAPVTLPARSIYRYVAGGVPKGGSRSRAALDAAVEQSLRTVRLWEEVRARLHRPARDLSEGQQQRLRIARAVAGAPRVLLLDEPGVGLDPISTLVVEDAIGTLTDQSTVVVATSGVQHAMRLGGKVAFLARAALDECGRLVEYGDSERVFNRPQQRLTAEYIAGRE